MARGKIWGRKLTGKTSINPGLLSCAFLCSCAALSVPFDNWSWFHESCTSTSIYDYEITRQSLFSNYTFSHPENDRDVTDRVQEYTLQDASFMRQSRLVGWSIDWLIPQLRVVISWLIDRLIGWLVERSVDRLVNWSIGRLIDSLICWSSNWLTTRLRIVKSITFICKLIIKFKSKNIQIKICD